VREGRAFLIRGAKSLLRLEPLVVSSDMNVSAEDVAIQGRDGEKNQMMFTLRLHKEAAVWRNAVVLSWSRSGQPPKTVLASTEGDVWRFSVDGRVATLDWISGAARTAVAANSTK